MCCSPHPPAQRLVPQLAPEMVLGEGGEAWFLRTAAWAPSSRCHPWVPHLCPQPRYQHRHGWQMLGGAHRPRAWRGSPPCRWLPGVQLEGRKWEEWQLLATWPEGLTAHVHPGVRPAPGLSGGFHGPRSTWAVGSTDRTRGAHRAGLQRLEKSWMAPKCPSDRPEVATAPRGWNASAFLDVPGECFPRGYVLGQQEGRHLCPLSGCSSWRLEAPEDQGRGTSLAGTTGSGTRNLPQQPHLGCLWPPRDRGGNPRDGQRRPTTGCPEGVSCRPQEVCSSPGLTQGTKLEHE